MLRAVCNVRDALKPPPAHEGTPEPSRCAKHARQSCNYSSLNPAPTPVPAAAHPQCPPAACAQQELSARALVCVGRHTDKGQYGSSLRYLGQEMPAFFLKLGSDLSLRCPCLLMLMAMVWRWRLEGGRVGGGARRGQGAGLVRARVTSRVALIHALCARNCEIATLR